MSLITIALFMSITSIGIPSKSDHMTPMRHHSRNRKVPRVLTTAKPTAKIIPTTNIYTTAGILTINESAVTIPSTASTTANFPTTEKPARGISSFFSASIRAPTTNEPIFGIIHYSQAQKQQCLKLKEKCIDSRLFCCKTQTLNNGEIVNIDGFCYIFRGQCESRVNFTDYNTYVTLAKKLHKSTWERLNP